jgi:hypothetical protein
MFPNKIWKSFSKGNSSFPFNPILERIIRPILERIIRPILERIIRPILERRDQIFMNNILFK